VANLTLHHLEQSRSQRVLWLLEELGVDYEIERYPRTKEGRAPDALREVHPLGRSPVITHQGRVIAESGALVEYLVDHFGEGRFRPAAGSDDFESYRFFMHFAEGSMTDPLLVKLIMRKMAKAVPLVGKVIASKVDAGYTDPEIRGHLDLIEHALEGREWLAGELSGADVMMSYPVRAGLARSGIEGGLANVRAYAARIEARPAYVRAVERGGTDAILG